MSLQETDKVDNKNAMGEEVTESSVPESLGDELSKAVEEKDFLKVYLVSYIILVEIWF